jgi:cellulose synthase/poly-beta-1,6-N-acetylglucosamine synthase-like glycosyltransferase
MQEMNRKILKDSIIFIITNYPKIEVIAVRDNSTDSTLKMVKAIKSIISSEILRIISLISDKSDGWTDKT